MSGLPSRASGIRLGIRLADRSFSRYDELKAQGIQFLGRYMLFVKSRIWEGECFSESSEAHVIAEALACRGKLDFQEAK